MNYRKQVSDVLCYKPIPIIYRTSLLQNSLKVIITWMNFIFEKKSAEMLVDTGKSLFEITGELMSINAF